MNIRKHRKKNEIIEALNKCQTKTETTINREINELKQKLTILKKK
jgi:hypothetical protein